MVGPRAHNPRQPRAHPRARARALQPARPAGVATGLLVCAAAPGGPTGPLFTRIARADLGFGTSLQVLLSVLALVSAPLTLELLGGSGDHCCGRCSGPSRSSSCCPLTRGMAVRHRGPAWAERLGPPMGKLANLLLLLVIAALLVTRGAALLPTRPRACTRPSLDWCCCHWSSA